MCCKLCLKLCFVINLCFAYITYVVTGIALLTCVTIEVIAVGNIIRQINILIHNPKYLREQVNNNAFVVALAISLISLVAGIVALISFLFSATLYNGIKKRQPDQLKAYLRFGITITALVGGTAINHFIVYDPVPSGYVLIACGVYLVCLMSVGVTYGEMKVLASNTDVTCHARNA